MIFLSLSLCATAQNDEYIPKLRFEIGANFGIESFFSSDLSILDNQPHENYFGQSVAINLGVRTSSVFAGLDFIGTALQPNHDEDITLYALGIYTGDYYPFNNRFGAKLAVGCYWRYYTNEFIVNDREYKYNRHGFMASVLAGLYFKANSNTNIEATIKYSASTFENNDKTIDGIPSTLPKNSVLSSITPSIGINFFIP